jgi:hypothetical protein
MTPALRAILFGSRPWSYMDWFRSSEQGAVYEADNPADGGPVTAYVENTGITPVTAPGQGAADCVIGLLLDKRFGGLNARGAEEWPTNFLGRTNTVESGTTLPAACTSVAAGLCGIQISPRTTGKWYYITVTWSGNSAGKPVVVASGANNITLGTTASGSVSCHFLNPGATNLYVSITATAGGQAVSLDSISVRELPGNHATQATTASKPVLTARYNQALSTEDISNAAWTKLRSSAASASELREDATAANTHLLYSTASALPAGVPCRFYAEVKPNGRTIIGVSNTSNGTQRGEFTLSGAGSAAVAGTYTPGVNASVSGLSITALADGYYAITGTILYHIANQLAFYLQAAAGSITYDGDGVSGVLIRKIDLRTSADAALSIPAYQRVTDASNYDVSGFPCFFRFDGFDDSLSTAAIDFTATDKMSVVAGVTKLSDSATGMLVETSTGAAVGSFSIRAPQGAAATYTFYSIGTSPAQADSAASFAAPNSAILVGQAGISTDVCSLRVNGTLAATIATDQGTGNYGTHAINIGRRNNTNLPFNGRLTSLILRGAASSDAQITKAERYVARKMGLGGL